MHRLDCSVEQPTVAVITPYYNTGAVFSETAQSVFTQTMQNWEWIIVNDGSTDPDALEELERLRSVSDPRICIIDQENQGLPGARNNGVRASRASLIFFLDSDDILLPTALERLVALLSREPRIACATTWVQAFGAKSFLWQHGFSSGNMFLFENSVTALCMVRRSVFDAVGGFDEARTGGLEDYEFWFRCAASGYWGGDIPEPLIMQRYKHPAEYVHYRWPVRDDPARLRVFQREMRARHPELFRIGVPLVLLAPTPRWLESYARDRIALLVFPLTRFLRNIRLCVVDSAFWSIIGPTWRRMKI